MLATRESYVRSVLSTLHPSSSAEEVSWAVRSCLLLITAAAEPVLAEAISKGACLASPFCMFEDTSTISLTRLYYLMLDDDDCDTPPQTRYFQVKSCRCRNLSPIDSNFFRRLILFECRRFPSREAGLR